MKIELIYLVAFKIFYLCASPFRTAKINKFNLKLCGIRVSQFERVIFKKVHTGEENMA